MEKEGHHPNIESVRHSLAHVLAMAVLKKFPKAKLGVGPVVENGFYYDFKLTGPLSDEDLPELEKEMRHIISTRLDFKEEKITLSGAKKLFKDQPFKLDLIKDFSKEKRELTAYHTGAFTDLCRGGHIENTSEINADAFKLDKTAGAYWKGAEKNEQLTRIYGLSFETKEKLERFLSIREEAVKRDHRKLGQELGLFVFSELVGPGLPLYTPRGTAILQEIKNFSRSLRKEMGYEEVQTPNMNKGELFKTSGHYNKFKDDMFTVHSHFTKEEYFLKPMNCPQHTQIYSSEPRSYRDLPLKFSDFAMLYRDEKPGELSGLTRLRSFTQDDGHCFLREDQIKQEFALVLGAIQKTMKRYGLDYFIRLSLRDEKNKTAYLGTDAIWERSQSLLNELLRENSIECVVAEGEAAFYGPKMDLMIRDSLGRQWQLSTIQLDFNMPIRFGLSYIDADGKKVAPAMIHSALVGSPERFFGILIEHYVGDFPFWLSPIQISLLSVNERVIDYCRMIQAALQKEGFRIRIDDRNESIGKKIREAELSKAPYALIVGDREAAASTVSVRRRKKGDLGVITLENLIKLLRGEAL